MDEQKIIPVNGIAWPLDKYERQKRWKKRNPDKVRAYAREYERERRKAMRGVYGSHVRQSKETQDHTAADDPGHRHTGRGG